MSQYFGQDVFENGIFEKVDMVNPEDFNDPLKADYQLQAKGFADKVSGIYILRMPYLEAIRKNPALQEQERKNRLDLEKVLNIYPSEQIIHLKFPAGYRLAEIPAAISHRSDFSQYTVDFKVLPDGMRIHKKQQFMKNIIELEEFDAFKADYLRLMELDKFKVALFKK